MIKGSKHTEATKAKMRATHTGIKHKPTSAVGRANLSAARMGHKVSEATRDKISAALMGNQNALGREASEETRASMSVAAQARMQTPEGMANMIKARHAACTTSPTKLERALYRMLDAFGWEYDTEVPFAPYIVDAYIPGLHLALEADGAFHFEGNPWSGTTPEQEAQLTINRDAYLLEHYDLQVWHFNEEQLNAVP